MSADIPKSGDSFTEKELYHKFGVKNSGRIRPSTDNKVIILINSFFTVNIGQGNYQNTIDEKNGILYYVGGSNKNQEMIGNNKSVLEAKSKGFRLFYFEKPRQNHLIFKFEVEYASHHWVIQKNSEGIPRKVIKFKLIII